VRRAGLASLALALGACSAFYKWPEPPRAKPAEAPPPAAGENQYAVRAGDTLYSIAFRNQVDYRDLAAWNDIGPDYVIHVGQVLNLRGPAGGTASSTIKTYPAAPPGTPAAPAAVPAPTRPPAPVRVSAWRWPTTGPVVKAFGDSKGVDIGGEFGQPVRAAAPGKVVYSGSALRGYGELVIIKHDDVYLSAYGYNRRRLVAEGETVAAGQPIAELGFGPDQKPVLHFEVREKGRPVDPMGFLPKQR
jgi:lipoprotein NlpD